MRKHLKIIATIGILVLLGAIPMAASASPGTPVAQVACVAGGTATNAQARVDFDNITGTGAAGFTIVFTLPDVGVSATTGACVSPGAFGAIPGCNAFDCTVVNRGSGNFSIEGVCSSGNPGNLMGNVQGPTIALTNSGAAGTKTVDLLTNAGAVVSEIFDADGDTSVFTNDRLIDGFAAFGVPCEPTAVTMAGFDATSDSPAPFAAAAWPLLAGAAAVAAGGAYALLRRKS
jgi:hypothetical protein